MASKGAAVDLPAKDQPNCYSISTVKDYDRLLSSRGRRVDASPFHSLSSTADLLPNEQPVPFTAYKMGTAPDVSGVF